MFKPLAVFLLPLVLSSAVIADEFTDSIKLAMKSEIRTEKDTARDSNRRPAETLKFFGIKPDMKVLELIPGGGWYTKLLAPALKQKGEYYVAFGTSRIAETLLNKPGFEKVKISAKESEFKYNEKEKLYDLTTTNLNLKNLDAVLTFRNYHNLTVKSRTALNESVFKSLKPGGIYGVIDHTRRHMQANNDENGRRVDPVLAIKEIQAAGFEFVDFSSLHYKADDELRYEVGRKTVTGNTDRFTFLFKKPE
jgi:predicted methyltransferase